MLVIQRGGCHAPHASLLELRRDLLLRVTEDRDERARVLHVLRGHESDSYALGASAASAANAVDVVLCLRWELVVDDHAYVLRTGVIVTTSPSEDCGVGTDRPACAAEL